jgi:zinc transporter
MNDAPGMIFSCALDGTGNARDLTWQEVKTWSSHSETLWVHGDRTHADIQQWLQKESGINPLVVDALLAEETRPRITNFDDSILLILRGVNIQPDGDHIVS